MKRYFYLDALRLFAMIGVIAQHSIEENDINLFTLHRGSWLFINIISIFSRISVPIFVMISGAVILPRFGSRNIIEFYTKSARKLLIPLFIWSLVYLQYSHKLSSYQDALSIFYIPSYYHLWFVYMIFGLYLSSPFISMMLVQANKNSILIFLCLWLLFYSIFPLLQIDGNRFALWQSGLFSTMIGWFILGYVISQYNLFFIEKQKLVTLISVYCLIFIMLYLGQYIIFLIYGVRSSYYCQDSPLAILFTAFTFYLAKRLLNNIKNFNFNNLFMCNFSMLIYNVYFVHALILNLYKSRIDSYHLLPWSLAIMLIVLTSITSFGLILTCHFLERKYKRYFNNNKLNTY